MRSCVYVCARVCVRMHARVVIVFAKVHLAFSILLVSHSDSIVFRGSYRLHAFARIILENNHLAVGFVSDDE